MSDLNSVALVGRAGADPEVRYTAGGTAVANVRIAVSKHGRTRDGEKTETTTWVRVVFWDKVAKVVEDYVRKGSQIGVQGELRENTWTDKEGNKRSQLEVAAYSLQLLGGKRSDDEHAPPARGPANGNRAPSAGAEPGFDDDIPF